MEKMVYGADAAVAVLRTAGAEMSREAFGKFHLPRLVAADALGYSIGSISRYKPEPHLNGHSNA